jgi:gamma-glutamyltranspeptidase/glutathione hydrolase
MQGSVPPSQAMLEGQPTQERFGHCSWTRLPLAIIGMLVGAAVHGQTPPDGNDTANGISRQLASGQQGALVTGSRPSAEAALAMLQSGGNAVDAAVASMLVQSVVESQLFCFGSEVPIMVYDAQRQSVEVIAGLGAAPQLATPEWFVEHRQGLIQGRDDIANVVVPGFLDACLTALKRHGSRSFGQCAAAMLEVLQQRIDNPPAANRRQPRGGEELAGGREAFVSHHRNFKQMIERLVAAEQQAGVDRIEGLQAVSDYFYRGPIAHELDAWSQANGGLLRYADLAQHTTPVETPLSIDFHGYRIYKCGVWTQGPYLLQTLRLIETLDLVSLEHNSPDYVHWVVEAMKLALADRDTYFGDPNFVQVPIENLLSDAYIELRRPLIDPQSASLEQVPGDAWRMRARLGSAPQDYRITGSFGNDTTSCLVADRFGNVVAATPSGWGGVIAGDTGIELGSRMIGLNTWEEHPSRVAPGKRPRITLTPTLVLQQGRPVLAISVAGGDQQDQAALQVLLNRLVFELDPLAAVRRPRFGTDHHINWFGHQPAKLGSLTAPADLHPDLDRLRQRGHRLELARPAASAVLLVIDPETGVMQAAGDRGRIAGGY